MSLFARFAITALILLTSYACSGPEGKIDLPAAPSPNPTPGPAGTPAPGPGPGTAPSPNPSPSMNPGSSPAPAPGASPIPDGATIIDRTLTPSGPQALNPLKGFFPFQGSYNSFPHAMEFFYMPLNEVFKGANSYDFTTFESALNDIASRGHQVVFRFYLDYPAVGHGVPQFLINAGVNMISYTQFGGGQMPDYKNPTLISALSTFIAELGRRYDGDPRIAFIFTGLIGHWGEWHTFPQPELMATVADQTTIVKAFDDAFNTTRVLTRMPASYLQGLDIGLHDDSFAFETLPSQPWHFVAQTQTTGLTERWKTAPMGGELRPEIQQSIWDPTLPAGGESFSECVTQTRASWMLAHQLFGSLTTARHAAALAGAASMGYDFVVKKLSVAKSSTQWNVTITVENRGVAPFYYKWPLEIGYGSPGGPIATVNAISFDLPTIAAGQSVDIPFTLTLAGSENRSLYLRVKNPLSNGIPLRFSNSDQDKNFAGWLNLGDF